MQSIEDLDGRLEALCEGQGLRRPAPGPELRPIKVWRLSWQGQHMLDLHGAFWAVHALRVRIREAFELAAQGSSDVEALEDISDFAQRHQTRVDFAEHNRRMQLRLIGAMALTALVSIAFVLLFIE